MIDLSEKSREELFREKKEAELRAAKMREGEWKRRTDKERKCYLEDLLEAYESYEPYIKFNKEKWKLKGLARIVYERKHIPELE